jgi:hypothetical protein
MRLPIKNMATQFSPKNRLFSKENVFVQRNPLFDIFDIFFVMQNCHTKLFLGHAKY